MIKMLKALVRLMSPRDLAESTAPFSLLQLIFGQLPYNVIKSPKTKKYELRTSIPGMILCIGHLVLYISSLVIYLPIVYHFVETKMSSNAFMLTQLTYRTVTLCIFITTLLRRDLMKRYALLLNKIDVNFGETDRKFIYKRIFYTVTAITIFITALLLFTIIYVKGNAHLVRKSENSELTIPFVRFMPFVCMTLTDFHYAIIDLVFYWHICWLNKKLCSI